MADKKNKEITPTIDIFDNADLTEAALGLKYKQGDTEVRAGLDKTFLKNSDDKVPKKISAGVSTKKENLSYGFDVYKQGENRGATAGFTFRFNTGGEVEIGKGKDYIKDLL